MAKEPKNQDQKSGEPNKELNLPQAPKATSKQGQKTAPAPQAAASNPIQNSPLGAYLFRKAMAQELRKERHVDLEALRGVLGEYLGCYLFIGYDLSHEPVVYVNAPDQMAADALSAALNRFFYASKNQIPKNGDEDGGNPFLNR